MQARACFDWDKYLATKAKLPLSFISQPLAKKQRTYTIPKQSFLYYLALDITANCICEIHWLALDGLDLNTVHKLRSKREDYPPSQDSTLGLLAGKQECFLCAYTEFLTLPILSV